MVSIAVVFARLLLPRLVGLPLTLLVARHERLRLCRNEAGLLAEIRKTLALVVAVLGRHFVFGAGLRLVLAKLLLRRRDQAEIMLGVLVIILGRHRIAGTSRVARQLHVFFSHMGGGAANLDIGAVGFENPGHRVLAASVVVVIVIVIVPVTHPLVVVLTVSHVLPLLPALELIAISRRHASCAPNRRAVQVSIEFRLPSRSTKTRSPTASYRQPDQIIQPAKTSPGFLA